MKITDDAVLRALNAHEPRAATADITDWAVHTIERMRDALEAALSAVPVEGEVEWEFFNRNAGWVRVPSEEAAYLNARYFRHQRIRSRTVTTSEWQEVTP